MIKHSKKFYLEKRKNVPNGNSIYCNITYGKSEPYRYYTGYRVKEENWNSSKERAGKMGRAGRRDVTAEEINVCLSKIETAIGKFFEIAEVFPTDQEIKNYLDSELQKITMPSKKNSRIKKRILVKRFNKRKSVFFWKEFNRYIAEADVTEGRKNHLRSMQRTYFEFSKHISKDFTFNNLRKKDIKEYKKYLLDEVKISKDGKRVKLRGENRVVCILKGIKGFYNWIQKDYDDDYDVEHIEIISPFKKFEIGKEVYGEPHSLTREEQYYSEPCCLRWRCGHAIWRGEIRVYGSR